MPIIKNTCRALALPLLVALGGCAISHGVLDVASAERIKVGQATKNDILRTFGKPPVRHQYEGRDMWAYSGGVEKGDIFTGKTGQDMTTLSLTFNGDVVATCQITRVAYDVWARSSTQDSHECGKTGM